MRPVLVLSLVAAWGFVGARILKTGLQLNLPLLCGVNANAFLSLLCLIVLWLLGYIIIVVYMNWVAWRLVGMLVSRVSSRCRPVVLLLRCLYYCVEKMLGVFFRMLIVSFELLVTVGRLALVIILSVPSSVPLLNAILALWALGIRMLLRLSILLRNLVLVRTIESLVSPLWPWAVRI